MSNGNKIAAAGIWVDIISKVTMGVLTVILGFVAWQGQSILETLRDHEMRLVRIEANRYTAQDAIHDRRQYTQEIRLLREWVEENFPPAWLRDDIDELKRDVREIKASQRSP